VRLGGTPASATDQHAGALSPTVFYTFPSAGRIFACELTFTFGTNNAYAVGVQQLYARVTTASGIILGTVRLTATVPSQSGNGQGGITAPESGIPVAKGDQLIFDVNNGVTLTGNDGVMDAECSVLYSIP
jgi:hypothetical protein